MLDQSFKKNNEDYEPDPQQQFYMQRCSENRKQLEENGIIHLNADFTPEVMEYLYTTLAGLSQNRMVEEIHIMINSNGGSVAALMPIVDIIDIIEKPVHTRVLGKAYSCGALLLLSGHKGKRQAHKHSDILLHEVSSGFHGSASEMENQAAYFTRWNDMAIDLIRKRTKMTKKQIEKYMGSNRDIFISAEEALEYGIIDKIVDKV